MPFKKGREAVKELLLLDVAVLTVIMFGQAIYNSSIHYLHLLNRTTTISQTTDFSIFDNYYALASQMFLLFLAFLYLKVRNFDFRVWNLRATFSGFGKGLLLFLVAAICMDVYWLLTSRLVYTLPFPAMLGTILGRFELSTVLYAILNGFYEEIYFLGIITHVKLEKLKYIIPFSLLIRFSFHTYQGVISALGLGFVLGGLFYFLYKKSKTKNLFPFFVAHAFADIIGLGILYYILPN
ncbi:type II CAAX prenyl endopeptidase Rce1 family protein [Acetivibrio ethanolgignens]|uniref:CAAX prenyl protease 2/Lysostaphin resistance protein A-like domain-containing protein n=1 Tax=Acetivibrio ethanolgignens TaxID=290052 RepID=A0A0V8QCV6_9FIRM|nr:CPBP family glutamic-type intramembrane protease [Acetivibrio ethanolgignens]KSV58086.1 hypothetical protein ASU35_03375 [Acetivibrio ethanolgignens]